MGAAIALANPGHRVPAVLFFAMDDSALARTGESGSLRKFLRRPRGLGRAAPFAFVSCVAFGVDSSRKAGVAYARGDVLLASSRSAPIDAALSGDLGSQLSLADVALAGAKLPSRSPYRSEQTFLSFVEHLEANAPGFFGSWRN